MAAAAVEQAPARSIRHRLLALSLLPLLGVLPLLGLILLLWGNSAIDSLLIGKVRSDLAVAQGYFERVLAQVGSGTQAVAESHRLHRALGATSAAPTDAAALAQLLGQARRQHGFDFLNLLTPDMGLRASERGLSTTGAPMPRLASDDSGTLASVALVSAEQLRRIAPDLAEHARIRLVPTDGAAPTERAIEERALLLIARARIEDEAGRLLGWLQGGMLLNRNLAFIDHINEIVYPQGSLPFDSQGTATLFLDDVRISTNVRLFGDPAAERAIGTRVSAAVRAAVLGRGETWLDRAFVVKDWYVSGYLPLSDAAGQRVGMLYVGFLERPLVLLKYAVLAGIGLVFFAVMLVAAWWSLRSAGRIFKPLERMTQTMRQVERGEPAARVGPLRDADELGQLGATLDHLLDVIDDKTRALQRWGTELDHKVAERTRDLEASHAELQTAQQQLVRAEKLAAIGQLTASIAHEVNNPIAVIQGNLDLMRELLGPAAAPVRDELKLIDAQIERMRLIVTQLLQFARPNEYAGYVEPLQVREVIESSLVLVRHLLERSRIRLDWHCASTRQVAMNRQELQQVLINLLVNAIQAMQGAQAAAPENPTENPAEPRLLRMETRDIQAENGQARVRIDVIDQGPGLDSGTLARLFEPFFTTRRDGNGLGLWISRSLLERYGAELHAANRSDGAGAVFSVDLPALDEPPAVLS
ncbi:MAG: hypothetical protein RLY71_2086 [Pseudomonadota bacterium]|jgi:signal transduction histidine kinase